VVCYLKLRKYNSVVVFDLGILYIKKKNFLYIFYFNKYYQNKKFLNINLIKIYIFLITFIFGSIFLTEGAFPTEGGINIPVYVF